MAVNYLLFVFFFASQFIAGFNTELPPSNHESTITILSIDGGGIRGIIPAVILNHLEKALQVNTIHSKQNEIMEYKFMNSCILYYHLLHPTIYSCNHYLGWKKKSLTNIF